MISTYSQELSDKVVFNEPLNSQGKVTVHLPPGGYPKPDQVRSILVRPLAALKSINLRLTICNTQVGVCSLREKNTLMLYIVRKISFDKTIFFLYSLVEFLAIFSLLAFDF